LCHWNFSLTYSFRPHYGPGIDSASNKNEYQECFLGVIGGRCVGLTTLPPSYADCLKIWEPQVPGILVACPGLFRDYFAVGRGRPDHDQQQCYHHAPTVKAEAATAVVELLTMGMSTPETC
jgi:hypothetical protein